MWDAFDVDNVKGSSTSHTIAINNSSQQQQQHSTIFGRLSTCHHRVTGTKHIQKSPLFLAVVGVSERTATTTQRSLWLKKDAFFM